MTITPTIKHVHQPHIQAQLDRADEQVKMMRTKVEEIAAELSGTAIHDLRDDGYITWLSSTIVLHSGMTIYFRSDNRVKSKPVFNINIDWNIGSKNGKIWDRFKPLIKDGASSINVHCRHSYGDITEINISALKDAARVTKEIKSRLLTPANEEIFTKHVDRWIDDATTEQLNQTSLKRIAAQCRSMYPNNLDRVGSDSFSFSTETYKSNVIKTTFGGKFDLTINHLTEAEVLEILKLTGRLK